MNKALFLLLFGVTLIRNSSGFYSDLSSEASQTVKDLLLKWENKELDLSIGCAQQMAQVLQNLLKIDDGAWALKMFDATGKFPYGLAEGNVVEMGSFDECIKIKSDKMNITGKYCSVTVDINPNNYNTVNMDQSQTLLLKSYKPLSEMRGADKGGQPLASIPLYGVCLPDKCSEDDLRHALRLLTTFLPLDIRCQTQDDVLPPLDTGAIVTLSVFGVVIVLMLFSTITDYMCQGKAIKAHPVFISFSAYTNGQKLFRMGSAQGDLSSLHGIRFLSMCWVILGHVFIANLLGPTVNLFEMLKVLESSLMIDMYTYPVLTRTKEFETGLQVVTSYHWKRLPFLGSTIQSDLYMGKTDSMLYLNCAHAVDTFFVLSGLLVSYNFMKKRKKGEKFNIIQYYVHRYLRLTPAYAVVILCSVYLLKYLGSGPLYYKVDTVLSQLCRDHWWKALIYLQNYLAEAADICVSQSWNLNIDYQLYIISPILLYFLYKTPRFGTLLTALSIIGFMSAGFIITYQKKLGTMLVLGDTTNFMHYYYLKTHTRAATWFIGAWLGYVLGRIKFYNDKFYLRIPRVLVLLIWLVVLAAMPVCIFGFHNLVSGDYNVLGSSFYNTFTRPIWALCVSWVIFACSIGYGGLINDFLSLPIFGVLSRFTYSVYLVHLTILYIMVCSRKVPSYFSVPGLMNQFCSVFALSFIIAVFWILAFEMPILVIEPYIFGGVSVKKSKKVEHRMTADGRITEIQPR